MVKETNADRGAAERAMLYTRHDTKNTYPELESSKKDANNQIVKLLQQVRTRLEDIERERTEMWDTLQEQNKVLTELEDRSTSAEKSFLSIENRISRKELSEAPFMERLDEIERAQKENASTETSEELRNEILGRLEESDLQTSRLIERIDEAMAMQTRMNRRIDKVVQDKQRLNRKISLLEESVDATRQALSAKALVLLTDKGIMNQMESPSIPLFRNTGSSEDIFSEKEITHALPKEDDPVFTAKSPPARTHSFRNQAIAASVFVVVAATAGWLISHNINSLQPTPTLTDYKIERYVPPEQAAVPSYETDRIASQPEPLPERGISVVTQPLPETYSYDVDNNRDDIYENTALALDTTTEEEVATALNAIEPVAGEETEPEKPARLSDLEIQAHSNQTAPKETPTVFEGDKNLPQDFKNID